MRKFCFLGCVGLCGVSASVVALAAPSEPDVPKLLSESVIGSVALLDQATALAVEAGVDTMLASSGEGQSAFATLSGGASKYNTGSRVKLYSGSALFGYNVKFDRATLGAFLESGYGQSEGKVGDTKADSDQTYYGAGLAASFDFDNRAYVRAVARAGAARNKFKGYGEPKQDDYSDTNFYAAGALSVGRAVTLENRLDVDFYARYTFNFLKGGSTETSGAHDRFEVSDVTTHAARVGFRMSAGKDETLRIMSGIAYERVFSAKAKAKLDAVRIDEPNLEGDVGILEVGARYRPNANWTLSLVAKGYFFTRQGVQGEAYARYRF